MKICDGTGQGFEAKVDDNNRLSVEASVRSAQSRVSLEEGKAFQVVSGFVDVATSEQEILLIKNNSKSTKLVITYMRMTTAGVADWNAAAYFKIYIGNGSYTSGGDVITPVNMNTSSGAQALDFDFYSGTTAIVADTGSEIDIHPCANQQATFNKEGALVIAPGGMITINHIGSTVAGSAYARISFYLTENGGT